MKPTDGEAMLQNILADNSSKDHKALNTEVIEILLVIYSSTQ